MKPGTFRIIGGQWKKRRFPIPESIEVKPTLDRLRETLFNWLMHKIQHSVCLDAFAGSGALGLEALSRGASEVYFIDSDPQVIQHIKLCLNKLHCTLGEPKLAFMPALLAQWPQKFDLVFLDPPFYRNWITLLLNHEAFKNCLKKEAWVYVEAEKTLEKSVILNPSWKILRETQAGQVKAYLLLYVEKNN